MRAHLATCLCLFMAASSALSQEPGMLDWDELPAIPDALGFAGPFAGVHNDALIVAGGANFPKPVWDNDKVWHDRIFVLTRDKEKLSWNDGGVLDRPIAYGAAVSTEHGVVCIGGNDSQSTFDTVFLLTWDPVKKQVSQQAYPSLPSPCAFGAATRIGDTIYLAGGQAGGSLDTAMTNFWSLDLSKHNDQEAFRWQEQPAWPGASRAFNLTTAQHNGFHDCVYVMSGRREDPPVAPGAKGDESIVPGGDTEDEASRIQFLRDVWEFTPATGRWRKRKDAPRCLMAGTSIEFGQSHIFVLGGATEKLFFKTDELKDQHPGFIKKSLAYHTITDTWIEAGPIPQNHVTTVAVRWGEDIIVPSGEVRPRVRSPKVFRVRPKKSESDFGAVNYAVLIVYLMSMVGIGVYFARKSKNTDDYFRGGKQIPWWAAGCSIFATMLSSLTFTGLPSKAFAQDWTYAMGNMMIPVVAIAAVYIAMPFFRRIDATSAYEYLELRFDRRVRLFGSAAFTVFHIFRMAVVMSLTGLALAVATPLTPMESVLLMGVLSIAYSTMGGVEAVIWTDTIQTFVLLGGAVLAIIMLVGGVDGGWQGFIDSASSGNKFNFVNTSWSTTGAHAAVWVFVLGGIGQNVSSYTADQAVVQRYMTTADENLAARSIWTNAFLALPATFLFFTIGAALFAFYQSNPTRLDPTISTDQVFPLFIAREMPIGLAGLIVAGIFAAAQSTVSTSMNSTATTIVTDFLRPFNAFKSEDAYFNAARIITFTIGVLGTCIGLLFVSDPNIKSLFDVFLKVIGFLMGILGGLFVLGALTRRANAPGALIGAIAGAGFMIAIWKLTDTHAYLYGAAAIAVCVIPGYLFSLLFPGSVKDVTGLTVYSQ